MSNYSQKTRHQILDLFSSTNDINHVEIKTSRLSSSIFSIHFWYRFTELLYNDEQNVTFIFRMPLDIDKNIFEKIENQIKKLSSELGEYNKTKIGYILDPTINEAYTNQRIDGISITNNSGITLKFEALKEIEG